MLIVVSGLPGTGKSAVASELAAQLGAVHLSIDPIEDALLGAGLPRSWETGVAAYEATRAVAEQNLVLGRTVVVDAVNDSEPARDTWRAGSAQAGVRLAFVLLTLDDQTEHRRRLEGRVRELAHVREPSWKDVRARAAAYAPWVDGTCLHVSAEGPVAQSVVDVMEWLDRFRTCHPPESHGANHHGSPTVSLVPLPDAVKLKPFEK
ncbi:MAG TPA: AAA family ATPase [Micromonospora sp.]|nr:AAA family ATPase [Micromonospora sp.]